MIRRSVFLLLVIGTLLLGACTTPTPEVIEKIVTEVVLQTVEVEVAGTPQMIEVTKVVEVEKVITATPEPVVEEPAAAMDKPLVVAILADPENLDPHQYESSNSYYVISEMFEGLVQRVAGVTEIRPWLAESWTISDDGLQYVFKLRQDVKFHDGTPFNAEAVKFNVDRQSDEESPYFSMGTFFYWPAYMWPVESVEVVDEYSVAFNLSQPYPYFISYLCGGMGMMVSPAAVEEYGEDFVQHPVGTGPYKFAGWEKGQQVSLTANEDYWGDIPAIKDVVFRPIAEDAAKLTGLLTNEVDLAPEVSPMVAEQLRKTAGYGLVEAPTGSIWFLSMNVQADPFTDVRVRQAVAHAINKEAIVHNLLRDSVDIAQGPISPAYQGYSPDITVYEYNPEKSKELLAEAGYPDGFTAKFDVPQSGSGMQMPIEMATAIQADLAAVGIVAEIEITDFNTWMDRIRSPEVRFAEMSWNVSPTVEDDILSYVFSEPGMPPDGFNTSWYNNPDVQALLVEAQTTVDDAARIALLQEAQNLITEDCPAVFIDHNKLLFGITDSLKGFSPDLDGQLRLATTYWGE